MMVGYVLLAVLNGGVIGLSRTINGRLSQSEGPFVASFYNHLIGALSLLLVVVFIGYLSFESVAYSHVLEQKWYTYLGGVIGALYVVVNSHIITRIGALKSTLFVVSGQILTGVLLDLNAPSLTWMLIQFTGVGLIIFGVYLSMIQDKKSLRIKSTS